MAPSTPVRIVDQRGRPIGESNPLPISPASSDSFGMIPWDNFEDDFGNFNTADDHVIAAAPGAGKAIRWGLLFMVNNGDAAELITLKYGDDAKWTFPIAPGAQGHVWDMRNNPRTLQENTAVQLASAGTNEIYWYFEWQEVDA